MKVKFSTSALQRAQMEPIRYKPTWADIDGVWGLRVPLEYCPMPKPDDWVVITRLDGDTDEVQVDEVLRVDAQYAYCSVYPR